MLKYKKNLLYNIFIFLFFFFIFYRIFLNDYRMALENTLGYWPYQLQIIFYETGNKNFEITAPANIRFLGLVFQYLIFKFAPCLKLVSVEINPIKSWLGINNNQHLHADYICATFSNVLMNYFSFCGILTLTFFYSKTKLKLNLAESLLTLFLTLTFLNYLESSTLDRVSVLYLLIILCYLDNKNISIILIILSCLVNEKIIYTLGVFFFIRYFFNKQKKFKPYLLSTFVSAFLFILIFIIYTKIYGFNYFQHDAEDGIYNTAFTLKGLYRIYSMFLSPSGFSNTVFPLIISISAYVLSIYKKIDKLNYSKIDILIPISLLFFCLGGGMTNGGRYVMYSLHFWTPILSVYICSLIKTKI